MQQRSLLPQHESKELHALESIGAKEIAALNDDIQKLQNLANPDICDEKYLPFLAYAFKVDFWDESLSVDDKRRLISASLLLHQKKGTIWALERVFEALDMKASVSEWFSYDGDPYHFKIDVEIADVTKIISQELIADLRSYVEIYKNVRSVLDEVNIRLPIALGKIELAIGSTMTISFSNEIIFEKLKKSIALGYGVCANIALSNLDVVKQNSTVAHYIQDGTITDVALVNSNIIEQNSLVEHYIQSATVSNTNLNTSDTISQKSDIDVITTKGGVINVQLENESVFEAVVTTQINITGGVSWQY